MLLTRVCRHCGGFMRWDDVLKERACWMCGRGTRPKIHPLPKKRGASPGVGGHAGLGRG